MFDFSFNELLVIAVAGLLILGPKELPVVARSLRRIIRQVTSTTSAIKQQVNELLDEEDIQQVTHMIQGDDGTYYESYMDKEPDQAPSSADNARHDG